MSHPPQDRHELISAYVDGELSQDGRAEVLARAARDPAIARELATVTRLKATLEKAVPVPEMAVPEVAQCRVWRTWCRAAAAIFVVLAAAAGGWLFAKSGPMEGLDARLDWAMSAHRAWTALPERATVGTVTVPVNLPSTPYVPDLSANGLELVHATRGKTPAGAPTLTLGYTGSRGCRLTMIAFASADLPTQKTVLSRGDLRAGLWRAGGTGYLLVAEGMNPDRFHLVAESLFQATRSRTPLARETRTALRENRANSPPCTA